MRFLRAWWEIFKSVGGGMRAGRQTDQIFRYFVIRALKDVGLFGYLEEPHAYGEILATFEFEDSTYLQDLLGLMTHDKQRPFVQQDGSFQANQEFEFPEIETILGATDPRIRPMVWMAEAMSSNIIDRMRAERLGLRQVFERDEFKVVNMFNQLLGSGIYTAIRRASFALLTGRERRWLEGKHLLDIGCGNGQETAEIWLMLDGQTEITAIDAVPGMLELAENQFEKLLDQFQPDHRPLTSDNHPVFKLANAVELPFEDNCFDAAYWSIMLHWTSDPAMAIKEAVRVVRPGGLIFGAQGYKPYINPYLDLVLRSSRNSYGAFWKDDYVRWFIECGQNPEIVTPAGLTRVIVQ